MTELEQNARELGALYEAKRTEWETAVADVGEDQHDDEYVIQLARRLGLDFEMPAFQGDDVQWCTRCGAVVVDVAEHAHWHELVTAGIKVATVEAHLSSLATYFLVALMRFATETSEQEPAVDEVAEEEWADSGHGWIYPAVRDGDGIRARCGGPMICRACRSDELHSLEAHDGAADRYYVRTQAERAKMNEETER